MYRNILFNQIFKKILIIFSLLVFITVLPLPVSAALDKKVVRVGIFAFDGFYNTSATGVRYGYGYDYLFEIAKYANFEYEFVEGNWSELQVMLQNGEIDLLDSAQNTPERTTLYNFSDYPTGISYGALFALNNNTKINYTDFENFNSCKVGLLKDNSRNKDYFEYAKENNFKAETIEFDSSYQLNRALREGAVDLIVTSNLRNVIDEKEVARFTPSPFYMITNKNNPQLMEEINTALKEIQTYKMYFNLNLYKKYYETSSSQLRLTRREKDFLETKPIFTMVYPADWSPFEYTNSTESISKVNSDIINLISKNSGLGFNLIRVASYEQCLQMVRDGNADFLMYFDDNSEKAHGFGINISDVFISTPLVLVGKDTNITDDKIIALPKNYINAAEYAKKLFSKNQIFIYNTQEDCYNALLTGRADYTFENINVIGNILKEDKYKNLSIIHAISLMNSFVIGTKKDIDPLVMEILNKSIAAIPADQIESIIYTNSLNKKTEFTLAQVFEEYRAEIITTVWFLVIIALGVATYIIFMQKKTENMLWKMAYIDEVTGICNLNKFKLDAKNLLENISKENYEIIRFDVKQFKLINDMFGFEDGNQLLLSIVKKIQEKFPPDIVFARITGDNFVLLCKCDDIMKNNHLIIETIEELQLSHEASYSIDFSIGIYTIKAEDNDIVKMLERVNMAHKEAKQRENNAIVFYNDAMRAKAIKGKDIENKMEMALQRSEFKVFLQPKYSIIDEKIVGAEALVRWQSEQDTFIYPNEFIPIFEQNGFILKLDMYMLRKVCSLQKKYLEENITPVTISVNFSRNHLQNENFVEQIIEVVKEYNIPPHLIEIELTENAVIGNEELLSNVLAKLHKVGITFSMDDFGTGYSSLGLLKSMRIDVIKIDKSFFDKCNDDARAQTVVASIVSMANNLKIKTVAEGVETKENLDFLHSISSDIMVQGYYFAKPMPISDFENLLIKNNEQECS